MHLDNHTTIRRRLEQAARLVASTVDDVKAFRPRHAGEELQRRELELVTRAVLSLSRELARSLSAARLPIGLGPCPHCGWSRRYESLPERCPRCSGPLEPAVGSEARRRDSRRAS